MNDAHLHLIVNHLPIVGLMIGILVFIAGLVFKRSEVQLTALGIFIFSALTSIAAFYSGEAAEEVVENIAGISETRIHLHEENAETFFIVVLILGAISLLTFFAEVKKLKFAKYLMALSLMLSIVASLLAFNVGRSGGEIRHSEIQGEGLIIPLNNDFEADDD